MAYDKLKELLDSGILEKLTADKAAYEKVINGGASEVLAFAKANGIDLDESNASAAYEQIKKISEASTLIDAPGGGSCLEDAAWS